MSNQMSEGDFDSIIENELVEASEDEMDALEILTSRVSLGEDAEDEAETLEIALAGLLDLGRQQGYLTLDAIAEILPNKSQQAVMNSSPFARLSLTFISKS